jgi:hypothetical protein
VIPRRPRYWELELGAAVAGWRSLVSLEALWGALELAIEIEKPSFGSLAGERDR